MRKFVVAAVVGLALAAGEAAAQESAVVNLGNPLGHYTHSWTNRDTVTAVLLSAAWGGIIYLCLSSHGSHGNPASP